MLGKAREGPIIKRTSENSVVVYRAKDELEARFIVSMLKQNGIEAMLRIPETPAYNGLEMMWLGDKLGEIVVLESDLNRATELIKNNIP